MRSVGWPGQWIRRRRDDPPRAGGAPSRLAPARALPSLKGLLKAEITVSPAAGASALVAAVAGAAVALAFIAANEFAAADQARAARVNLLALMESARSAGNQADLAHKDAPSENPYVAGATETLAAAEIDRTLRRIVAEASGAMLSSRIEAKHEDGRQTRRIEAEITIEGGVDAIQSVLYSVETSEPFLFVEALSMHPADGSKADAGEAAESPLLRATLIVSAFWKGAA